VKKKSRLGHKECQYTLLEEYSKVQSPEEKTGRYGEEREEAKQGSGVQGLTAIKKLKENQKG